MAAPAKRTMPKRQEEGAMLMHTQKLHKEANNAKAEPVTAADE